MKLTVNGEARELAARTVEEALLALGLENRPVAVERNKSVVPRAKFRETELSEGDRLEIVQFVGGG
jgi:thiamine biosynthesis protein ThiS